MRRVGSFDGHAHRRLRVRVRGDVRAHRPAPGRGGGARRRARWPPTSSPTPGSVPSRARSPRRWRSWRTARSTSSCASRCSSTCGSPTWRWPSSGASPRPAASASSTSLVAGQEGASSSRRSGSEPARPRRWTTTSATTTPATSGRCSSVPASCPTASSCFRHKFGLNTFAVCRVDRAGGIHVMTFSQTLPRRDRRAPRRHSTRPRRAIAAGLAAVREARRAALHPRRRRFGRPRQPRRQRLPEDLRLRGLRADRQRVRADRPDQRRGLGRRLRRLARRAPAFAPTTGSSCSRSAAATPSSNVSRQPRPSARAREGASAPRCSASWAATAATRPRSPTPAS